MIPHHGTKTRARQQEARAWSAFTGTKYTSALRQMRSPLTQGLLGEQVSARDLIATLNDHELIGTHGADPVLGSGGMHRPPFSFNRRSDYVEMVLITETLRMFTPVSEPEAAQVGSYSLKHTVEDFLGSHCSYVSNGALIWAAAAMGLPIAAPQSEGPNLLIGISELEHHYAKRRARRGLTDLRGTHYRPPGYEHLQAALSQAGAGEIIAEKWVPPVPRHEPAPFHDWLVHQAARHDEVGVLAVDYQAGVRDSDHDVAATPEDLLSIVSATSHSPETYDALLRAIAEYEG